MFRGFKTWRERVVFFFLLLINISFFSCITFLIKWNALVSIFSFSEYLLTLDFATSLGSVVYLGVHRIFISRTKTVKTKILEIIYCAIAILPIAITVSFLSKSINMLVFTEMVLLNGSWIGQITFEAIVKAVD